MSSVKRFKAIMLVAALFMGCIWVYPNSACAANNKVDGFPMQGQDTGMNLTLEVAGHKLNVSSISLVACSSHNLSWIEGSMDFPISPAQNPAKVFQPFNLPPVQWESDTSWDDSKIPKVDLRLTTVDNDGRTVVDVTLKTCMIFFHNGVCLFRTLKGTGKFKDKSILDFDGTDDSRETLAGASLEITCDWPRLHR